MATKARVYWKVSEKIMDMYKAWFTLQEILMVFDVNKSYVFSIRRWNVASRKPIKTKRRWIKKLIDEKFAQIKCLKEIDWRITDHIFEDDPIYQLWLIEKEISIWSGLNTKELFQKKEKILRDLSSEWL